MMSITSLFGVDEYDIIIWGRGGGGGGGVMSINIFVLGL